MPAFFIGRRRVLFALLMFLSFAQVGIGIAAAHAVGRLFGGLNKPAGLDHSAIALLLGSIAATAMVEIGRRRTTEALGLDYARKVRAVLFEGLLRRPLLGGGNRSRGSVLLPFVGDLTALRQWWADGVARGISSAIIAAGLCLYLGIQSWQLGVALALLSGLSLGAMALCALPYARATRLQRRERGVMTALISDRLAGAHTVFAMGGLRREVKRIDRRALAMNQAAMRRATWSGTMRAIAASAHSGGILLTLLVAALTAGEGGMAQHRIVGSLMLVGLVGACISDMARAIELAIPARIARARLEARLAEVEPLRLTREDAAKPVSRKHDLLRLQDLRLTDSQEPFSANAEAGDVILVDGDPGSGKSTLLAMIAGFQPTVGGVIRTGGHATTRLPQALRRSRIGYAGAAAPLLQTSLADNLHYRWRGPFDNAAMAALMHDAGLAHWLDDADCVIARPMRDQGRGLAGADLQAIHIIRAMAGAPALLVIDDWFGALTASQLEGLLTRIRTWPGAVVLTSARPEVRAAANRRWCIRPSGIVEAVPGTGTATVLPFAASPRV